MNTRIWTLFFALAVVAISVAGPDAHAQRARNVTIASQDVSLSQSSATIDASQAPGAFRNLRIVNRGRRIRITNLKIYYHDGSFDEIGRRFRLTNGERTRVINKGNSARFVDKVVVKYRAKLGSRRRTTRVVLEGTQSRREARRSRPRSRGKGSPSKAAYSDQDVLFGYRNVDFKVDRDEIEIGQDIGKFMRLRLKAVGSNVFVRDLRIDYRDGSIQSVPLDTNIKQGKQSEWIDVEETKFIDKIVMFYRAKRRSRGTARVEVTGQFAEKWLDPTGEGRKYNDGWMLLGAETASAIGYDTDTISVAENEGGFSAIRLKVHNRSITLRQVRVVYDSGTDEVFKFYRRVDPGQTVGPLQLAHSPAAISKIVARYRTRLFIGKGTGTGLVEVWARH